MWRMLGGLTLLLLISAAPGLAQEKGKAGRPDPRRQQDLTPLVNAGWARGRIARIHSSTTFTLEVFETRTIPGGRAANGRPGPPRIQTTRKPFVLDVADEVEVRMMEMPLAFDDMGRPRKHTPEEVKELKGDNPNIPGYRSDYERLRVGQIVDVSFRPLQPASAPDPGRDTPGKVDNSPRVTLIVVLSDGDAAAAARKGDAERKKKK
jgi:hypothetical protein